MGVEGRIAVRLTGFPERHLERLERVLARLGLARQLPPQAAAGALVEATRRDKKVRQGRVRYALPVRIGRMPAGHDVTRAVDDVTVAQALEPAARPASGAD
jgi:3-dehydroquinate synthase